MNAELSMPLSARDRLRCPICHGKLTLDGEQMRCMEPSCVGCFPVVNNKPVLVNEKASVFSIENILTAQRTFFKTNESKLKLALRRISPKIGNNLRAARNYPRIADILLKQCASPLVLVLGGSILGEGLSTIVDNNAIEFVESDVQFGPRTMIVCDAHDIPFEDSTFDGVIVQAVLEHVTDPQRCVEEIRRVLKSDGIVYAETPFMQQVHGGRYDFTRFTHLGHRRLFRHFDEINSGAANGPGMALAWSYQYFLLSFATSRVMRLLLRAFARFTAFHLKYFDYYLLNKPGSLDAASGFFFTGRKSDRVLSDQELIELYEGML